LLGLSVRESQPATQVFRRFVGSLAIERHQRSRAAGRAGDLGAPLATVDAADFDEVLATIDDLFKAMHVERPMWMGETKVGFYRLADGVQAKGKPKAHQQSATSLFLSAIASKKIWNSFFVHRHSTILQQLFHMSPP
jgi:hypothetical protein